MVNALLLVLAAAPQERETPVLVRFFLGDGQVNEADARGSVLAAVDTVVPLRRAAVLKPEATSRLEPELKAAEAFCADRLGTDMSVAACRSHARAATEARVFATSVEEVLDIAASQLVEKPDIMLEASVWNARSGKGLRLVRTVPIKRFAEEAGKAALKLLSGEGTPYQRPTKTPAELAKTWRSPFKPEAARRGLPLVLHTSGCTQPIPPKLGITPDDALARTVADRWETSVRGHQLGRAPERCTLAYLPLFDQEPLVHVTLTCGAVTSSWTFTEAKPLADTLAVVSQTFVASHLEQRCTGAFGDTPSSALLIKQLIGALAGSGGDAEMAMDDLVQMGPRAVPALTTELGNPNPRIRQNVATTLGYLGAAAREAVPALQQAAKDADRDVAAAAQRALQEIK